MSDMTRLLDAAAAGDRKAADELLPLVYDELRALAAATAMRRILVESARSRRRLKRGGRRVRIELLDVADSLAEDPDLLLSLDELLSRLAEEDDAAARLAHLHLFGGLSVEEAGEVLGLSRPVAYRNWKYARAWLRHALEK
jgi:RNA polymerase sigma factor (TIGR02999 family)